MSWGRVLASFLFLGGILFPLWAESQPPVCLPILCYHGVSSHPASEYEVSLEDFRAQMRYLKERGYGAISLTQWIQCLDQGAPLPARAVVLTFDDAHISAYQTVFPLLKSYGLVGTFFISPGLLSDQRGRHLTWVQLRQMAGAGMDIMPHGHCHTNLARRKAEENQASYRARVREDVLLSRSLIQSHLGSSAPFFAYPYGAFDQEVEEIMGDAGFSLILTACPGVNTPQTHRSRLKRQLIYRDDGVAGFVSKLEALPLETRFPFEEGVILPGPPQQIDIDLPHLSHLSSPPLLLFDRKEVAISYDEAAQRISFSPPAPIRAGLHMLEVRVVEGGSGRWYQDSTLFAIRPPEPDPRRRNGG